MATIRESLVYAIKFVTTDAQKGLSSIKKSVGEADGAVNKFKAGSTSAMGALGVSAGALAVTGGAALVAFGKKAVDAFTETAKAAIDLSTATGLSVEEASRWIAVGDDFQVTAEALATGLGKVAKTLDAAKWETYGIATRDASGEARDVNDILLDTFDMLSKVTNETERARIGQELFGKGYQSLTPLLGQTREEYEKMLQAQKDGQVITAEEAATAERTRLAYDELADTMDEFALLLGQSLAPAAAQAAEDLAAIAGAVLDVKEEIDKIPGLGQVLELGVGNPALRTKEAFEDMVDVFWTGGDAADAAAEDVEGLAGEVEAVGDAAESGLPPVAEGLDAVAEAAQKADPAWQRYLDSQSSALANAEGAPGTFEDMERAVEGVNEAAADAAAEGLAAFQQAITDAQDAITGKFDEFRDTLDMQDLLSNIAEQVDAVNKAAEELGEGGETEARNYRGEVRRLQGQVVDLLETYDDLPPQKITEILTRISTGDVNEILRVIDELTKDRFIKVGVIVPDVNNAYDSINTRIGAGVSAPIFNNPNPAPSIGTPGGGGVSAANITINTLTSSPARQYVDRQIDDRRNGVR